MRFAATFRERPPIVMETAGVDAVASKVLKDKEPSNSDDMKFLGENLFGIFFHIYTNEDDVKSVLLDGGEVNE